jgi:acyl dehydratase
MAILTHPEFPVPIWRILQTRNDLVQHRPIDVGARLDFEVCVEAQRILQRGAELDLRTLVRTGGELSWESLVTFYTRGRFGEPDPASPRTVSPEVGGEIVARWQMPKRGSWRFGQLTGDHNGIHHSNRYARMFGFRGALYHPPVVLGHCLSHVLAMREGTVRRFEAWLKGPVYRGSKVALRMEGGSTSQVFALFMEPETRPSIVGRVTLLELDSRSSG